MLPNNPLNNLPSNVPNPSVLPNLFLVTRRIGARISSEWRKLVAGDLGTGSTGAGTRYLADDLTWKTVSGGGGGTSGGGTLDGGDRLLGNSFIDGGSRV